MGSGILKGLRHCIRPQKVDYSQAVLKQISQVDLESSLSTSEDWCSLNLQRGSLQEPIIDSTEQQESNVPSLLALISIHWHLTWDVYVWLDSICVDIYNCEYKLGPSSRRTRLIQQHNFHKQRHGGGLAIRQLHTHVYIYIYIQREW